MSEPINSVDFMPIHFPDGGPSGGLAHGSNQNPSAANDAAVLRSVSIKNGKSAEEYAVAVQNRFQEAGSSVRVGIESVNGNTVFTIKDTETGQVIRKIPSDEAIRISNNLDRLTGLFLDRLE